MLPAYIATDSEFFIKDGDEFTTSIGKIGGSKHKPLLVEGGNLQEDNVLGEFAIDKVKVDDNGLSTWIKLINQMKIEMQRVIAPLTFDIVSSHVYDVDVLQRSGRQAFRFSCEPDYNAYEKQVNPEINYQGGLRVAGGHIHLSWDTDMYDVSPWDVIKSMDIFLGIPSVLMDEDKLRRTLYGQAGSMRPKKYPDGMYGVEYRTLSNFWTKNEELMKWAYNNTLRAFSEAPHVDKYITEIGGSDYLRAIINTGIVDKADELTHHLGLDVF
jgi:hypothetical protein